MREMAVTLVSAAILCSSAMAQQAVVGKIEVNVVNVDVTVSSHGQPVRGLTGDDFEVFEDGVPQPLSNFYPVERAPVAARAVSVIPADSATSGEDRFRRKVLVIIDNAHSSTINRNRALEKLERFINERFTGGEYDWSIAVAGQRLRVVLPLTSDKQSIHDALAVVRGSGTRTEFSNAAIVKENAQRGFARSAALEPGRGISNGAGRNVNSSVGGQDPDRISAFAMRLDEVESYQVAGDTFVAIRDATRAFANSSGKKIVLLFSDVSFGSAGGPGGGIEQLPSGTAQSDAGARAREANMRRDSLIREANASNVNLYIIDPEGLTEGAGGGNLYWLAAETGGRFMPGNRPELSLKQFDEASSNYYSLGFRPPHGEDARYHHVKVRLKNHSGYQLQYRDGYTSLSSDVQIVRLLLTPFSNNLQQGQAMGLSVTAGQPLTSAGLTTIPLVARIPVKNLQFVPSSTGFDAQVDVYVSIFDSNGKNVSLERYTTHAHATDAAGQQAGDLIHNANVKVKSGKPYTVVVAVRDQLTDAFSMRSQTLQF